MTDKFVFPTIRLPLKKRDAKKAKNQEQMQLVKEAVAGNRGAIHKLVRTLTPVVQTAVAQTLTNYQSHNRHFSMHDEVADHCQEIFLILFNNDSKILKSWDPEKGMSLSSFISLVTKRRTISALRQIKPMQSIDDDYINDKVEEQLKSVELETELYNRQHLLKIVHSIKSDISELGYKIFIELFLYEKSPEELSEQTGLSKNAIYVWRNRLRQKVKSLSENMDAVSTGTASKKSKSEKMEVAVNE